MFLLQGSGQETIIFKDTSCWGKFIIKPSLLNQAANQDTCTCKYSQLSDFHSEKLSKKLFLIIK